MEFTIKSKKLNKDVTFFANKGGGYIFTDLENGRSGTLGSQICAGGCWGGSTLRAYNQLDLEKTARNWYKNYIQKQKLNGNLD